MKSVLRLALLSTALLGSVAVQAQEKIVWWDMVGGGDGVRMKTLLDGYNTEFAGKSQIEATTLEWGVPYYTKVRVSAAVGEGPDIAFYAMSALKAGVDSGALAPLSLDDLAVAGLGPDSYSKSVWDAAHVNDQLYLVPFSTHSVVLYYNKDMLKAAGLLGDDGKPTGLDGIENFEASLQKLKDGGAQYGISFPTDNGSGIWYIFASLLEQLDGDMLVDDQILPGASEESAVTAISAINKWLSSGLAPQQTDYGASIALFTSGASPLLVQGVWESTTMKDLAAKGELGFEWGAIQLPTLYKQPGNWCDSLGFAVPAGRELTAEHKAAVFGALAYMGQHSVIWADAGHVPAYDAVRDSAEFKAMEPNATYAPLADACAFEPASKISGAGGALYDAAGNYLLPAANGEMDPATAIADFKSFLQGEL